MGGLCCWTSAIWRMHQSLVFSLINKNENWIVFRFFFGRTWPVVFHLRKALFFDHQITIPQARLIAIFCVFFFSFYFPDADTRLTYRIAQFFSLCNQPTFSNSFVTKQRSRFDCGHITPMLGLTLHSFAVQSNLRNKTGVEKEQEWL